MPLYMINLKSLVPRDAERLMRFGQEMRQGVGVRLQHLFDPIARGLARPEQRQFDGAGIAWEPDAARINPDEMVCYFVADRAASVISGLGGRLPPPLPEGKHAGTTFASREGMVSEIYLAELIDHHDRIRAIANMAFHELMHNKLDAATAGAPIANVHTNGGGGLANAHVDLDGDPTPQNRALMRHSLLRRVPQFTGRLWARNPNGGRP